MLADHTPDRFGYSSFQFSPIQLFKINLTVTAAGTPVPSKIVIEGRSESGQMLWTSSKEVSAGPQEVWIRQSSTYTLHVSATGYPVKTIEYNTLYPAQKIAVDVATSDPAINLAIKLKKVSSIPFASIDSVAIHYFNSRGDDIYHPLSLSGQYATGNVHVPAGHGNFRIIFFATKESNKISRQLVASFTMNVTPEMHSLHSEGSCIAVNRSTAQDCTIAVGWDFFNAHYLGSHKLSVVLPESDATSPFFEVWNRTGLTISYVSIDRKVYPVDDPNADLRIAYDFWECESGCFKKGHLFEMHALKDLALELPNRDLDSATSKVKILYAGGREVQADFQWNMN